MDGKLEFLSGIVERITFRNEENGFSVIKIRSASFPELITVVGNMANINIGTVLKMQGEWKYDSKYGKQFRVVYLTESVPATIAGIEKYLGSGLIKGIGPSFAKKIVEVFKDETLKVIDEEPDRLIEVDGIGEKRIEMIKKAWEDQKEIKNIMMFLQGHGVSQAYAVKIYKHYGDESLNVVKENPYRLADDIWGIGFKTADKIARKLGVSEESPLRLKSGVLFVLGQMANDGHCFATINELKAESAKVLEVSEELVGKAIDEVVREKMVVLDRENCVYTPSLYFCEKGVADIIIEMVENNSKFSENDVDKNIEDVSSKFKIKYDDIQVEAIKTAVKSKFMVLTGGPGTGKTTTILGIIRVFESLGAKVLLAAPTGRAAKRMSEATRREAKTIHRLLEVKPPDGYRRNQDNPLECDVLIIDETSMVDIVLMYNLLKAVPIDATVILVGDIDQLPSVGPGNVLRDIIESGRVSVVQLKRIFRQARGSKIITNAHRINNGMFPALSCGKDSDFFFIEEEDNEKIVSTIKELCSKRLPSYYQVDPVMDIQVLCPMQKGETGAFNLNQVLQETLNPSKMFVKHGGAQFRIGDKVMQIRNNYEKNVYNGDIGRITAIDFEERSVEVNFDNNLIYYEYEELDEMVLAYATTIHKSQGSEYKIVVAPFTMSHFVMLQRNLIYTCLTRAKKVFVLIGSKKAIGMAVSTVKSLKRNTMLCERLKAGKSN